MMTSQFTKSFLLCGGKFHPREGESLQPADEIHLQIIAPEGDEYQPTLKETIHLISDDRGDFVEVLAGEPPETIFEREGRGIRKPDLYSVIRDEYNLAGKGNPLRYYNVKTEGSVRNITITRMRQRYRGPDDDWREIRIDRGTVPEEGCSEVKVKITNYYTGRIRGITCKNDSNDANIIECKATID